MNVNYAVSIYCAYSHHNAKHSQAANQPSGRLQVNGTYNNEAVKE